MAGQAAPSAPKSDFGALPELAWLPVAKLRVDERYQRTLESDRSQKLIARVVENFRWSAFQAILATGSEADGYCVVDGQHRVEAARRLKIAHVPAVVLKVMSVEEAAAAFVHANADRVAVTKFALFHAQLAAGDEDARELDRRCKKAGIVIPRYPIPENKIKPGQTMALGVLMKISKTEVPAVAGLILSAVADAYRETPGGLRALYFKAAQLTILKAPPAERPAMAARVTAYLRGHGPNQLSVAVSSSMMRGEALSAVQALAMLFEHQGAKAAASVYSGESFIKPPTRQQLMTGRP